MPIGVICNALAIVIGGLIGAAAGNRLSEEFKEKLNLVFGACSMGMGVSTVVLMQNMPAVILALILGTSLGIALRLGQRIEAAGRGLQKLMSRFIKLPGDPAGEEERMNLLVTAMVLFCTSGTGIYGAIVSGMSGDHSILIAKSILDLPTSMIFACTLGAALILFLWFLLIIPEGKPQPVSVTHIRSTAIE